jgi:hypothetical protein
MFLLMSVGNLQVLHREVSSGVIYMLIFVEMGQLARKLKGGQISRMVILQAVSFPSVLRMKFIAT